MTTGCRLPSHLALACLLALNAGFACAEITYGNNVNRAGGNDSRALGTRDAESRHQSSPRYSHHGNSNGRRSTRPLETVPRDNYAHQRQDRDFRNDRDDYGHGHRDDYGDRDRYGDRDGHRGGGGYGDRDDYRDRGSYGDRGGYRGGGPNDGGYGYSHGQGGYRQSPDHGHSAPGYGDARRRDYGRSQDFHNGRSGGFVTPDYPRNIDNNPTYRRAYPSAR